MASGIGVALRGCVLACCVLSALSASTVTQQSSSAWGSVENGRTVDRGTRTSHTTDHLPDEPDLELEERFGGGSRRRQEAEPELSLRGGFGSSRPQPQPSTPGAGHDASQQPVSTPGVGHDASQPPVYTPGAGYDASQQPISGVDAINDAYNRLLAQYPTLNFNTGAQQPWPVFRQQQPNVGFPGGFHQQWTNFPQQQPAVGLTGGFDSGWQQPQPSVGADYDPSRQPAPGSGPHGIPPVGDALPRDAPAAVPMTPAVGGAGLGAQGLGAPSLGGAGAGGVGGDIVPSLGSQHGHPLFQLPDIHSLSNQITAQALQNIARGMTHGMSYGVPAPGGAGGQVLHDLGGGVPQPGQPRVQSQHASVNPFSYQRAQQQRAGFDIPFYPFPASRRQFPASQVAGLENTLLYGGQAQPTHIPRSQHAGTNAAWPLRAQPYLG